MNDPDRPSPSSQRIDQLLFAGLAGLSIGTVLQLVDKQPELDRPLGVALLCFAVALPMLVSSFLMEAIRSGDEKRLGRKLFDLAGVLAAIAGTSLLVFHLNTLVGVAFLGSTFFSVVVLVCSLR
jgi:hypothetical protein